MNTPDWFISFIWVSVSLLCVTNWLLALYQSRQLHQLTVSDRGDPASIPIYSVWDSRRTKSHWGRFFSQYFGFSHRSVLFLSFSSRHRDKRSFVWEPANTKRCFPTLLFTSLPLYLKLKVHSGLQSRDAVSQGDSVHLCNSAVRPSTFSVQQIVLCAVRLSYLRTVNRAWGTRRGAVRNHAARSTGKDDCGDITYFVVTSLNLWWYHLFYGDFTDFVAISLTVWWHYLLCGGITYCVVTPRTLWWYHLLCGDTTYFVVVSLTVWWHHLLCGDITYCVVTPRTL
jgi:hypothetical protein